MTHLKLRLSLFIYALALTSALILGGCPDTYRERYRPVDPRPDPDREYPRRYDPNQDYPANPNQLPPQG